MTAKRRSLGAAIDISDEKAAFIKGGVPALAPSISDLAQNATAFDRTESQGQKVSSAAPTRNFERDGTQTVAAQSPSTETALTRNRTRKSNTEGEMPQMANLLFPLTTRLSFSTAMALKRAGLEQKLYGRKPSTVQEIAEDAIKAWLLAEGYF
jgi:hypothetical protein